MKILFFSPNFTFQNRISNQTLSNSLTNNLKTQKAESHIHTFIINSVPHFEKKTTENLCIHCVYLCSNICTYLYLFINTQDVCKHKNGLPGRSEHYIFLNSTSEIQFSPAVIAWD